jgi:hypothetical protein
MKIVMRMWDDCCDDDKCEDYCRLVCSWKLNPLRSTCTECIAHHVVCDVSSELYSTFEIKRYDCVCCVVCLSLRVNGWL